MNTFLILAIIVFIITNIIAITFMSIIIYKIEKLQYEVNYMRTESSHRISTETRDIVKRFISIMVSNPRLKSYILDEL